MVRSKGYAGPRRLRRGLTLAESVVSALIVGLMMVPAMNTAGAVARSYAGRADYDVAAALANDLMGEILQSHFEDPDDLLRVFGPESDEGTSTRVDFNDVDDYDGWFESSAQEKDGTPLFGAGAYHRQVTVEYVEPHSPSQTSANPTSLKRITVEIVRSSGSVMQLVALRASSGVYESKPQSEQTYVGWLGLLLQVGSDTTPINSGINVVNQVPVQ